MRVWDDWEKTKGTKGLVLFFEQKKFKQQLWTRLVSSSGIHISAVIGGPIIGNTSRLNFSLTVVLINKQWIDEWSNIWMVAVVITSSH